MTNEQSITLSPSAEKIAVITHADSNPPAMNTIENTSATENISSSAATASIDNQQKEQGTTAVNTEKTDSNSEIEKDEVNSVITSEDGTAALAGIGLDLVINALRSTIQLHQHNDEARELEEGCDMKTEKEINEEDLSTANQTFVGLSQDHSVHSAENSNTMNDAIFQNKDENNDSEEDSNSERFEIASSTTDVSQQDNKIFADKAAVLKESTEVAFEDLVPPTPGIDPPHRQSMQLPMNERPSEDSGDIETHSQNLIALNKVDVKNIEENSLSPRQQERADEPVLRAVHHLFNNRFMKAKILFEKRAESDPLHALGLGSMAFLKAVMTTDVAATKNAIDVLTSAYIIAKAQIDAATKKTMGDSFYQAMTSYYNYIKFARATRALPTNTEPATLKSIQKKRVTFISNGVLRAHVAKAECCLQIAILQLLQENALGYIKCGMNLRRAYTSYSIVWQEYKCMGQVYNEFIDRDTISGIQFGIGAVHLVLSALPKKVLRIVSAFGWKADKHLGFALLKLCVEEKRIRSPMASLMLLAYYTAMASLCPNILTDEYTLPAIETLLDAQRAFPNSAFFLYFAGRSSRLAKNLSLSTQSFSYAIEISKNEWAEVEVMHISSYELALNHMLEQQWEEAASLFDMLYLENYWSPALFRYLTGACADMAGNRTEAILAYAEIPGLIGSCSSTQGSSTLEKYILRKVQNYQESGYQDLDMTLGALEYLYLFMGFDFMSHDSLDESLTIVDVALRKILEIEQLEYGIRTVELLPETPPPKYFNQRGVLLLIRSSLLNTLGRYKEAIVHLNWIIDQKDLMDIDKWVVPFAFWEAGVTAWGLNNKTRSRSLWSSALKFTKYDFEFRLAMRVNLAMTKADELAVPEPEDDNRSHSSSTMDSPAEKDSSYNSRPGSQTSSNDNNDFDSSGITNNNDNQNNSVSIPNGTQD